MRQINRESGRQYWVTRSCTCPAHPFTHWLAPLTYKFPLHCSLTPKFVGKWKIRCPSFFWAKVFAFDEELNVEKWIENLGEEAKKQTYDQTETNRSDEIRKKRSDRRCSRFSPFRLSTICLDWGSIWAFGGCRPGLSTFPLYFCARRNSSHITSYIIHAGFLQRRTDDWLRAYRRPKEQTPTENTKRDSGILSNATSINSYKWQKRFYIIVCTNEFYFDTSVLTT